MSSLGLRSLEPRFIKKKKKKKKKVVWEWKHIYLMITSMEIKTGEDWCSGVARAFPGGRLAHPDNNNEEEN